MDTDDEARADAEPSKKRNCKFDSKICICHSGSSSASSVGLLLFMDVTWTTFLDGALGGFQTLLDHLKAHAIKNAIKHILPNRTLRGYEKLLLLLLLLKLLRQVFLL